MQFGMYAYVLFEVHRKGSIYTGGGGGGGGGGGKHSSFPQKFKNSVGNCSMFWERLFECQLSGSL